MKKIYAMLLVVVMISCLCPVGMKEAKAYNEPGEVIELRNENNSANVLYDFDCDVKAGSTISFTITSTWEKPMAVWVIGDLTYEYYAYGYDSGTGTYTIEDTLEHDLSKIRIQVQYRNESHKKDETDKTGEVVTISNLEILSPDAVRIENPSGGKRVSYNVQKEVPAGRFVEFDISTNMGNQIAVWVLDEYIEYYAYGYENWTGKGHVRAEITRDISNFTILVEFRDTSIDFSQVVVTIDNIEITYPDIYSPEEGVIELRNSKNSTNVLYDFACDVEAGSEISFTFTSTWEKPVAVWVIGNLTYEYFGYGYDSGTGTYKVETTLEHDLSKLRIQVQYRTAEHRKDETSNKTKEVITITGLTITPPPHVNHTLVYHEAIEPTYENEGNVEYWYCSVCEGYWLDEACTNATTADAVKLPVLVKESNLYDVSAYRSGETFTAPTKAGCVFAGWYEDEACTVPMDADATEGDYYAKFIDADVLSVKAQVTKGTTASTEETNMRFISTVDGLDYQTVGFKIKVGDRAEKTTTSTVVYKQLYANVEGEIDTILPTDFCEESEWFFTYGYWEIPNEAFDVEFLVTPYVVTADGTTVWGETVVKTVSQSYS